MEASSWKHQKNEFHFSDVCKLKPYVSSKTNIAIIIIII